MSNALWWKCCQCPAGLQRLLRPILCQRSCATRLKTAQMTLWNGVLPTVLQIPPGEMYLTGTGTCVIGYKLHNQKAMAHQWYVLVKPSKNRPAGSTICSTFCMTNSSHIEAMASQRSAPTSSSTNGATARQRSTPMISSNNGATPHHRSVSKSTRWLINKIFQHRGDNSSRICSAIRTNELFQDRSTDSSRICSAIREIQGTPETKIQRRQLTTPQRQRSRISDDTSNKDPEASFFKAMTGEAHKHTRGEPNK